MVATTLNPAQIELLEMTSFVQTQKIMSQLKKVISQYFAKVATDEVDWLWDTGELTDDKVENFRNLHERTPY